MSQVPTPRSYSQILGQMTSVFCVKHGIPDLKEAGPILSILEAAAQSDLRATQDVFATADARSLDDAEGAALAALGEAEDVSRQLPTSASGTVDLGDSTYTKKATTVFGGSAAPIAGTTTLAVVSAADFPSTGSVYLGRGTSRYEGPIAYSAKANVGAYWTLTL